jgi:hypothetical protein
VTRPRSLIILTLLAALVLALPAASALAQSAGDNQYQDPLGGNSSSGSSGGGSSHPSTTPAQPAQSNPAPAQSSQSSGAHKSATTRAVPLAHTGFPAWIPLGGGLVLMAGGVLLLVKTPRRTS